MNFKDEKAVILQVIKEILDVLPNIKALEQHRWNVDKKDFDLYEEEALQYIIELPLRMIRSALLSEVYVMELKAHHFNQELIPIDEQIKGAAKIVYDFCKEAGLDPFLHHKKGWGMYIRLPQVKS